MLLSQVVALVFAAQAWGFAQGALVARAACVAPPSAAKVRPLARVPFQPEHGNRRF